MMKHLAHPAWRVGAETKLTEHVRKILERRKLEPVLSIG